MAGKKQRESWEEFSLGMENLLDRGDSLGSTLSTLGETGSQELVLRSEASPTTIEEESAPLASGVFVPRDKKSSPEKVQAFGKPGSRVDSFYKRSVEVLPTELMSDGAVLIPARIIPRRSQMDGRATILFFLLFMFTFLSMGFGVLPLTLILIPLVIASVVYPSIMNSVVWGSQFNVYIICEPECGERARNIVRDEMRWFIKESPLYSSNNPELQASLERKLSRRLRSELGEAVTGVEVKFRGAEYTRFEKRSGELPILKENKSAGMLHHALSRDAFMHAKGEENSNILPQGKGAASVSVSALSTVSPIQRRLRGITRSGAPENVKSLAQSLTSLLSVEGEFSPASKSRLGNLVHEFLDVMDDLDALKSSAFDATEEERARVQQCFAILEAPVKALEEEYLSQRRGVLESKSMFLAEKYGVAKGESALGVAPDAISSAAPGDVSVDESVEREVE